MLAAVGMAWAVTGPAVVCSVKDRRVGELGHVWEAMSIGGTTGATRVGTAVVQRLACNDLK